MLSVSLIDDGWRTCALTTAHEAVGLARAFGEDRRGRHRTIGGPLTVFAVMSIGPVQTAVFPDPPEVHTGHQHQRDDR